MTSVLPLLYSPSYHHPHVIAKWHEDFFYTPTFTLCKPCDSYTPSLPHVPNLDQGIAHDKKLAETTIAADKNWQKQLQTDKDIDIIDVTISVNLF